MALYKFKKEGYLLRRCDPDEIKKECYLLRRFGECGCMVYTKMVVVLSCKQNMGDFFTVHF